MLFLDHDFWTLLLTIMGQLLLTYQLLCDSYPLVHIQCESPDSNIVIQIVAPMCVTGKGRAHPALAKMELNIAFESLVLWNATAIARIMVSLMAKKPL